MVCFSTDEVVRTHVELFTFSNMTRSNDSNSIEVRNDQKL